MKAFPTGTGGGMDLLDYFAAQAMKAFKPSSQIQQTPKILLNGLITRGLAMIKFKKNINNHET